MPGPRLAASPARGGPAIETSRRGARADRVLLDLLDVLADEGGAANLELFTARVALLADSERDRLLMAIARAASVKDQLARHQRRERELQALFETARDLSSLRDVDDVLAAIVQRVRQLFGADSGYLALVDEQSGEAYMRTTSGTVSSAIETVRLRPGRGIGGTIDRKSVV